KAPAPAKEPAATAPAKAKAPAPAKEPAATAKPPVKAPAKAKAKAKAPAPAPVPTPVPAPAPAKGKGRKKADASKASPKVEEHASDAQTVANDESDAIKAIAKGIGSGASARTPVKKAIVATFTMDDVHEVLKNRREEAREKAQKIEAARGKTSVSSASVMLPVQPQQRILGAATLADILGFSSPSPIRSPEPANTREVPAQFRKYYDMLAALRDKVMGKINQRGRATDLLGGAINSTLPPQNDDDDSFDHDFALSLVATEQEALIEIDAAIERIHEGTYGICEITNKEIAPERLEAVPFTRFSVDGQAQFERLNRRRNQRTTTFLDSSDDVSAFAGDEADE
ncbi:MAG: TraR/DksA family transcriptional regulator, partial [Opitutales bacterium]